VLGLPALAITLSRDRAGPVRPGFLREVGWFALRIGLAIEVAGLATLLLAIRAWHDTLEPQRTLLLSVLVVPGAVTVLRALAEDEGPRPVGWNRPHLLVAVVLSLYLGAMYWPPSADFFCLVALSVGQWGRVLLLSALGHAACALTETARPA
jgi:hypothetical protein